VTNSIPIAALIMTGGFNDNGNGINRLRSVEVYVPSTNTSCFLPSLGEDWTLMLMGGDYSTKIVHDIWIDSRIISTPGFSLRYDWL